MEMMKTCCSEVNLNLESLSNCKFFIFISYFIYNFGQKFIKKTKTNKRNYFKFVLYYKIIRIAYFV